MANRFTRWLMRLFGKGAPVIPVVRLHGVIAALRSEGCQVMDKVEESEYGKFGWVLDPDGNKLELWEPPPGQ